jgi:RimJ/RimL family protein N-acetyltransferase
VNADIGPSAGRRRIVGGRWRDEPILRTPRLTLRRWLPGDAAALEVINADPEVTRYLNPPMPPVARFSERCIEHWEQHGFGFFAVESREGPAPGRFIGFVGIGHPAFLPELAMA